MSLIDRFAENIAIKQQQAELDLNLNFRTFFSSNGKDLFTRLTHQIVHRLEQNLDTHFSNVKSFLLQHTDQDLVLLEQMQTQNTAHLDLAREQKKPKPLVIEQPQRQSTVNKNADQARISKKHSHNHKKVLTQQSEASPSQHMEAQTEYNRKGQETSFPHEKSPLQHKSSDKAKHKHRSKNFNIKPGERSISHQHNQPQQKYDSIKKNQSRTLQQSQQSTHKQSTQKQSTHKNNRRSFKGKSRKVKLNLVKLAPIASEKQREIRQKEANQKLNAAIDFLNGLQSRKKIVSEYASEWKHQKDEIFAMPKIPSSPLNPTFLKLKQLAQKYRHQKSSDFEQNNLQRSEVTRKRNRKNQKLQKFVLEKPQPYNLYNINMAKHELFHYRIVS